MGNNFWNPKMGSFTIGVLKRSVWDFLTTLKDNFGFLKKNCIIIIYLWIQVDCFVLFWSLVMKFTELGCFRLCSWCHWKAFNEGCMGLVPWHLDLRCKSSWILNDVFIENSIQLSWKFWWNWNVPLVLLEGSWWAGFNGIYLVRFGFRLREMLIPKWFLLLKIQKNSKIPGFGRKNRWRHGNTWANGTCHTSCNGLLYANRWNDVMFN